MSASAARSSMVEAIHDSEHRLVVAVTGGGIAVLTDLLTVPGASRTVLEATVPYAPGALGDLLGAAPSHAVSADTAMSMASACLRRAFELADENWSLLGVGCTAALRTDRSRRGADRAHISVVGGDAVWMCTLDLDREIERSRVDQDRLVADAVLLALGAACDLPSFELALAGADRISIAQQPER